MSISQSASNAFVTRLLSSVAVLPPLTAAMLTPAAAQTALELPGIVVEGATLEVPPPAPQRRPVAASTPSPAPSSSTAEAPAGPPVEAVDEAAADAGPPSDQVAGIPRAQLGTAVTVVTGEDLQRQQIRHAADALRSLPGVTVARTGAGFSSKTQVRIRGAEGNHTLVLIDGIEANDPNDGEFDFGNLLADDIERVEVIRGPMSGIYGSGAVGGVINIITKSGKGPLAIRVGSEGGSYGTAHTSARVSGGNERIWASLSAQQRRSTGFNISPRGNEDDSSNLVNFGMKAGVSIWDGLSIEVVARNAQNRFDRDGFTGLNIGDLWTAVDDPSTVDNNIWHTGITARWDMLDGKLTHVLSANRNSFESVDNDPAFGPSRNESEALKYGYLTTYRFEAPLWIPVRHSISGLIQKEQESFTPGSDGIERRRGRLALAGEYRAELGERVFVNGSIRHDDNDTFQDFTTWRTAVAVDIPEFRIRPHASIGTGVRLPTMFEQFGSVPAFFDPNPDLQPERSLGWDAGIEFTLWQNRAVLDVTYFSTDLTDMIATDPDNPFSVDNLPGKSRREGVEVAARVRISEALSVGAAYTFLEATDATGEREPRRPPHSGRFDVNYGFDDGKGNFTLAALYNGRMDDRAFRTVDFIDGFPVPELEAITLDDYWLVTAAASYQLQPGLEIFGRVENLFDASYEESFGYNTPGIAAYAGVKFTLGGDGRID